MALETTEKLKLLQAEVEKGVQTQWEQRPPV